MNPQFLPFVIAQAGFVGNVIAWWYAGKPGFVAIALGLFAFTCWLYRRYA